MKHLSLRVIAESPVAIRSDQTASGAARAKYIPGSTVVGGLTTLYRQFYDGDVEKMKLFTPLFLDEQVLYPNLYPAIFVDSKGSRDDNELREAKALQDRNHLPIYPIPQTAQSCKRHSGFRFPYTEQNDAHGVRDTLIDWGLFKLNSSDQIPSLAILRAGKSCQHAYTPEQKCGEAMDHYDGYYRHSDIPPYHRIAAQSDSYTRLQTHTGIHRESGTVQDGILYNRQVYEEGMQFWGEILFPEDEQLFTPFAEFLHEIGHTGLLRLGTGRTRGMGKVSLAIDDGEHYQDRFTVFKKRLEAFDDAFRKRAQFFEMDKPEGYFFTITLHSPLILCDDLMRYRGIIDADALLEALPDYTVPGLQSLYHAASVRRITGWQELWGTPRAAEYAIESGSVFLFTCSSPPDETLLKAFFALEEQGMGKRRVEGFGRICISDRFHLQVQQEGHSHETRDADHIGGQ